MNFLKPTVAVCLLNSAVWAQTGCVRHFVNKSNFTWIVSGYDGAQSKLTIPANSTAAIPYGTTDHITVSGAVPNRPYTKQFQLSATSDGCYEILHQGNVGYITLNKAQNGDIVTCTGGC